MLEQTRRLFKLLADVLEYPSADLAASVRECRQLLAETCSEAAQEMRTFADFVEGESLGSLQEIYSRTFDVTPTTNMYVGYHLFGESYKRGAFLARLQEAFVAHRFSCGSELPDHLCVLLRFASAADDPEFVTPLLEEAILPALTKIEAAFQESRQGYALPIKALRLFLRRALPGVSDTLPMQELTLPHPPGGHGGPPLRPEDWVGIPLSTSAHATSPGTDDISHRAPNPHSASRIPHLEGL
ncbi:MAG: nitrate reductase molybdenum cofactor assembly chaperone [Chloroflexota bacterium]|nr:MAG: nitrate reductase molybdenum cofactor assembly chaperone [Chloroflexota bacterium]